MASGGCESFRFDGKVVVHVSLAVAVAVDFADFYIVGCKRVEFGQEGHERVAGAQALS